jgi:dihydroorotate dehydrogenase
VFRLAEDEAIINRLGFNSDGMAAVAQRLARPRRRSGIVAVNLGKNRDTADAADDYAAGAAALAPFVDLLVINVSSPNTPGLRRLQARGEIERIVGRVREASAAAPRPLLLKIAPDLSEEERHDIAAAALASGIEGMIVSNTTIARPPGLKSRFRDEAGGLSGGPLFAPSTELLAAMHRLTEGRLPLIGVGGIASGDDAYAKIRAGASLVQLYTALVYRGPALIARIARDLAARLRADGFASIAEAVGADRRAPVLTP